MSNDAEAYIIRHDGERLHFVKITDAAPAAPPKVWSAANPRNYPNGEQGDVLGLIDKALEGDVLGRIERALAAH